MSEQIDTVVIGGGQAGLAASYFLTQQGREHIVLEQHRIGEAWRSGRWDSFTLVTPNWALDLPGGAYSGADPDGFMPRANIVAYLEQYAEIFKAPVKSGVRVTAVDRNPDGSYRVATCDSEYEADNVIVATGGFQLPKIPDFSLNISPKVEQIHSGQYRNPEVLPPGAVLVVGSGQSGCQLAEELQQSGRRVYLTVGSAGRVPRRYRGEDAFWWLLKLGFFDQTIEQLPTPQARFAANPQVTGKNGGHTLNLHQFAQDGIVLLGHLRGADGSTLTLATDLAENMAKSDAQSANFMNNSDAWVKKAGLDMPEDEETRAIELAQWEPLPEATELDLDKSDITTIVWAGGYRADYSIVHLPILGQDGYPVHLGGVTEYPGLYFLGLPWLSKRKSPLLYGVGDDAAHIVEHIAGRVCVGR
jgi:putative flavoprotein involved in K+ transport